MIIQIVIGIFLLLEFSNVVALYFKPDMQQANAMGAFRTWSKIQTDPSTQRLVSYMVKWVAGTKLIFISLLIVVLIWGSTTLQLYSLVALTLSVMTYFWKLGPLIGEMDNLNEIEPQGYSRTLNRMIASFIVLFLITLILSVFFGI